MSGNEELQSTNEQLSTAKEELQSTNEELQTLNEELQTRNTELNQVNTDLNNLLASVHVPIIMLNNELRIRRFNAAAVGLLHLHPALVGRPVHAIDSPLIFPGLEKRMLEVVAGRGEQELEMRDASQRWFSIRLHPYRTSESRSDGIILTLVDIHDLKEAYAKHLDYTAAIVDTVRTPLLVLRADLQVNSANEAFYHTFGMTRAQTENRFIHELAQGQWNIPQLCQLLARTAAEQVPLKDLEITQEFPAVGLRDVLFNARPLRQKLGTAPLIFLSMDDITERKRVEQVNRWQAAIVESSGDAVLSRNFDGNIVSCNDGALKLFGYQAGELVGQPVTMLIPENLQAEERESVERVKLGERIENFETMRRRKDGSLIHVSLTVSPVKDAEGKIVGASKIAHDITARKRWEEMLADSLGREKEARDLAEQSGRAKDDFLAALSHELRTPLNPVLLLASDSADDPDLSRAVRSRFDTIRKNIELEARLIDDMLDLTRIASGKLSLVLQTVDVCAVLEEAITHIQSEVNRKHLKIVTEVTAEHCLVNGDPVRLQQIFWNVLKNAFKFTPADGKITIKIAPSPDDTHIILEISDTGIGMTEAELAKAFKAFSQGEHSEDHLNRFGGLGLGLAISHQLIGLHGGRIQARSEGRDKGATFVIELPLAPKNGAPPVSASVVARSLTRGRIAKKPTGRHILLVEDHEPTRTSLAHLLKRRGYEVSAAGSVTEAMKIAERESLDFVISDIGLPDGNGNDLMKNLAKRTGMKGIALTGYGMEGDLERSHAAGFVTHLIKPVHIHALEAALSSLEATLQPVPSTV